MHTIKNSKSTKDYMAKSESPSPFLSLGYLILNCKENHEDISYLSEVFYTTSLPTIVHSIYSTILLSIHTVFHFGFRLTVQLEDCSIPIHVELLYLEFFKIFKLHIIPLYGHNIIYFIIPNQWPFTLFIIFCCHQFCNELLYMQVILHV